MTHLSAGELLREEMNKKGEFSELINSYIMEGKIVPVEITCSLLRNRIFSGRNNCSFNTNYSSINSFLIDGFPRNKNNADGWKETIKDSVDIIGTIIINLKFEEIYERTKQRKREDDLREVLEKRMQTYHNQTTSIYPVLSELAPLIEVDGHGNKDEVFEKLKSKVKYLV